MNKKDRLILLRAEWTTLIGFVLVVAGCMVIYPDKNGQMGGYPFFHEFVSALGMITNGNKANNFGPAMVFDISLGFSMLMLIPFWYHRSRCIDGKAWWRWLSFICCCGFSLGILGVGMTPYDLYPGIHNISVYSAFALIVPGGLIMIFKTGSGYYRYPQKWWWVSAACMVLLISVIFHFLMAGHVLPHRPCAPIMQKVNIAMFIVWVAIELTLYRKYLEKIPQPPSPSPEVETDCRSALPEPE